MEKLSGTLSSHAPDTTLESAIFRLEDGREKPSAIVHRPPAVVVVALRRGEDGQIEVLLVHQPRPAIGEDDFAELVAGKIDPGEDALTTAKREIREEAGLEGAHWHLLSEFLVPASGYSDELTYAYVVYELTTVPRRDEDRHIELEWVPFEEALRRVREGEIRDLKARDALRTVAERHHEWQID